MSDKYDSTEDTKKHIKRIGELMDEVINHLEDRKKLHDASKLFAPEKEGFDEYTPKLKDAAYGSDEYKGFLKGLKGSLDHHYSHNSHHPEFYENGIDGMDLIDVIEMFVDWKAATERTKDGNLDKSIEHNKERFKMSEQLVNIFKNTKKDLKW
jgi:chromatin segregation and condensation protein Rec8/ScpA/Scc1 (kleisin family)